MNAGPRSQKVTYNPRKRQSFQQVENERGTPPIVLMWKEDLLFDRAQVLRTRVAACLTSTNNARFDTLIS